MNITIEKLSESRKQATVTLDDAAVEKRGAEAITELGRDIKIKGFRPGKAPLEKLKERIPEDQVHESVIQKEMPSIMEAILKEHELHPIIRPRVALKSVKPMTLEVVIVEEPAVKVDVRKLKGDVKKIKVEVADGAEGTDGAKTSEEKSAEERQKRDHEVLKLVAKYTKVELAPELIDDEAEALIEDHARKLQQYGIAFEDWLKQQNKSVTDLFNEMRPMAEERLKIRFGMNHLIKEWKIDVTDEEMGEAVEKLLAPLKDVNHEQLKEMYKPEGRMYEQFKQQKKVEKVMEKLCPDSLFSKV